jgi:aminopeptidase N
MRSRLAAALAATAMLAGLTSCSDDMSSTPEAAPTSPGAASGSGEPSATAQPDSLTAAVGDPVEDSVYPDVGDPSVDALHYALDLTWDPDARTLTGVEELTFRSPGDRDRVQLDLSEALEISALQVDGEDADFEHTGKDLVVPGDFDAGEVYSLSIDYAGTPQPVPAPTTRRDFSTTGFTISDDGSAWTMQEPYGAYSWYAVNDQPSDKAFYDFTLRVPDPWTGVANGVMTGRQVENGVTTSTWHLDSKTSSYLVTVAFGDYKVTEDESSSGVPISYWVPTSASQYLDGLRYTPEALAWVEDKLGPYPWSSLGILLVDSQSGMETQTMITLGATSYATSKGVLVHEVVHQWYGDRVTPSDWSDLWMNEGMAMYLQFVWQAEDTGTPLEQILQQAARTERQSRRVNDPPASYDPQTFGEIQVYYGPALMWDQVRRRVGDEKFWEMVRAWPSVDPDGSSNRDEYLAWVEEQTGAELSDLFDGWLLAERSPRFP